MIRIFLPVILGLLIFSYGCNVINPVEKIPTYLKIDSFQFVNADPAKTGTASHKITSAWVYYNNQTVGVFDLPATIPIIADQPGQIQVIPGITLSGLSSFQTRYDFYTVDTFSITPSPGNIIPHNFKTQYAQVATFPWIENFDSGSPFIKVNSGNTNDTSITKTTDPDKVFEGTGSGYIYLTSAKPNCENINTTDIPILKGNASYLELNYKCNVDFVVGLETTQSNGVIQFEYIIGLKATDKWNKVYIGLRDFVEKYNTPKFRVMIKSTLPSGQSDGYVLLDNLKVVSY